ncbi:hypothetical protein HanXRQr2_Chr12g0543761 [Helianthus annuus]|uniref:Uncharacterized protein n=1 Tax=Helianthus annuus TaxID=4232 RepID=A0A9K3HGU9_HELAN|nr:hypothetical protein HanXRQr2_Chr12g0543761 [Helianthus annuus]KAJ0862886.1 hypothetical protein HanPSC8_Chr12g0523511 [Helianthus annuus]
MVCECCVLTCSPESSPARSPHPRRKLTGCYLLIQPTLVVGLRFRDTRSNQITNMQ